MSTHYFDNFGQITYGGRQVTNILSRPKVLSRVSRNPYAFYNYTLKSGERPDTIAEGYYNDFYFSWIVYLSNQIIDPYYSWQLPQEIFQQFISTKYGSLVTANRKVICYRVNWDMDSSIITPATYNALDDTAKKYWSPMYGAGQVVVSYDRAELPWLSETNFYQTITLSSNAVFNVGDLVSNQLNGVIVSTAEIAVNNGAAIVLKNIVGDPSRYLQWGFNSGNTLTVGESATVANSFFSTTANVIYSNTSTVIVSFDGKIPTGNVQVTGLISGNSMWTQNSAPIISQLVADLTSGNTATIFTSDYTGPCIPIGELAYWEPWLAYEMEDEKNSALKNIRLLDTSYKLQALSDLKKLMG